MAYYKCGSIHPTQNSNVVVDTASGAIANFETPLAMPLLDAQIDVNAVQDLHGQSGAYPPGGGVNKWDEEWELGALGSVSGQPEYSVDRIRSKNFCPCTPSTSIYGYIGTSGVNLFIYYYDENYEFLGRGTITNSVKNTLYNAAYFKIMTYEGGYTSYKNDISINYPSTDHDYHPYSNICPINGWDEISVVGCGGNLWNGEWEAGSINEQTGLDEYSEVAWRIVGYIPVKPNTKYYIKTLTGIGGAAVRLRFYDHNKNYLGSTIPSGTRNFNAWFETPENAYFMRISPANLNCPNHDVSINYPSSDTEYHAYNPNSSTTVIQLNNTYYGGRFIQDKSGKRKFVVTHEKATYNLADQHYTNENGFDGWIIYRATRAEQAPNSPIGKLCNCCPEYKYADGTLGRPHYYISAGAFVMYLPENTYRNGYLEYTFPLETPYTIDLPDGTPFKSLPGVNNIFADTGDTTVEFRKIGE